MVDNTVGSTRLAWLGKGPTEASAATVKAEVGKLLYLRSLDAHTLDLSVLPAERRRFLAAVGRRLTAQALARREAQRRYPILLTLLNQSAADVLDEPPGSVPLCTARCHRPGEFRPLRDPTDFDEEDLLIQSAAAEGF